MFSKCFLSSKLLAKLAFKKPLNGCLWFPSMFSLPRKSSNLRNFCSFWNSWLLPLFYHDSLLPTFILKKNKKKTNYTSFNRRYRITPSKIIAMHFGIVSVTTKTNSHYEFKTKLIHWQNIAETRGKLKQTTRQAGVIYLYIK